MTDSSGVSLSVVAIGRNEGERLRRCLRSVTNFCHQVVYVDSASSDDSVTFAQSLGLVVVNLGNDKPFTAARARNAGAAKVFESWPETEYLLIVDGDCELAANWANTATNFLRSQPDVAVVCGRRLERYPEKTIYNRLCDLEWDSAVGEAEACGGDFVIRADAFREVGGLDPRLVAGEEPEMCFRLRELGWRIYRLDHDMTIHDADMTHFRQWWRRTFRSGHACAEGQAMHGGVLSGYRARQVWSMLLWGLILPIIIVGTALGISTLLLVLLLAYVFLWFRVRSYIAEKTDARPHANLYATFCILGKFAEALGVLRYWSNRLVGRRTKLIEYKESSKSTASN